MRINPHTMRHHKKRREESLSSRWAALAAGMGSAIAMSRVLLYGKAPHEPADAVVFLASVGVVLLVGWWVANVLAWCLALRRGVTLRRFTLPGSRHLAQLLMVLSLSSACVAEASEGPAMVLIDGSAVVDERATNEVSVDDTPPDAAETTVQVTSPEPAPPTTRSTAGDEPPRNEEGRPDDSAASHAALAEMAEVEDATPVGTDGRITAHEVIVRAGDNLWALAAETLERHGSNDPSSATIAAYWRLVVVGNHVRSGDANLIVPGETINMPAYDLAV